VAAPPDHLLRGEPPPLHGGPLAFLRFARRNGMLTRGYGWLLVKLLLLKLRWGARLQLDGVAFVCPGVKFEIGKNARLHLGRWSWIGNDTKIRVHEGEVRIGAKSVLGQECTISAFQNVSIGRECIVADRVMLIDFDHGVVEVERPVRMQGIYKRDVTVGHNVWMGYGACVLRGCSVGDNSVLGTYTVVTNDIPANAVAAGVPARIVRMRDAPERMRWENPVEPIVAPDKPKSGPGPAAEQAPSSPAPHAAEQEGNGSATTSSSGARPTGPDAP
jgi:acetyltransferase-like isoleucine patch superfamily enzyme